MAKRSTRIAAVRQKDDDEQTCVKRLFSIFQSCQVISGPKLISGETHANRRHAADQLREHDRRETRHIVAKGMDSQFVDCLVKTQKGRRKSSRMDDHQPSSCSLDGTAGLLHQLPLASAEVPLTELMPAALLRAVSEHDHQQEGSLSVCFQRSNHLGGYNEVDQIAMRRIRMNAKAFVDQMFIYRLLCKQRRKFDSLSFSDALDLFLALLPDSRPQSVKNLHPARAEIERIAPVLDASGSGKPVRASATKKGEMKKHSSEKAHDQCSYASRAMLKPVPQNADSVTCHCSSGLPSRKLSRVASDGKPTSFSFRGMKKKLKHTFSGTAGGPDQFKRDGTSDACIRRGMDSRSSLDPTNIAKAGGKLCKKQKLGSGPDPDTACVTESVCKKLDFTFSKRQEFDVILEAKRRLSARNKKLNDAEMGSQQSSRTLSRIVASPKHDLWPFSPGRKSQYCPSSAQMRFSPYNASTSIAESSSHIPNGRKCGCLSRLSRNGEVTLCDHYKRHDDTRKSSLIPTTDEESQETGESNTREMNPMPELHVLEASRDVNTADTTRTMQIKDSIKLQQDDENDPWSENEAFASMEVDFPPTHSSVFRLSVPNIIKFQEEHQSPVSVLQPFFAEGSNSPPSTRLQTAQQSLQPLFLDFEECSFESIPHHAQTNASPSTERRADLAEHVLSVLQASNLNWDQLSEIRFPSAELLSISSFNDVEVLPTDCPFTPKLLFDSINEVLVEIHWSHSSSLPWTSSIKSKAMSTPLHKFVLDKIMTGADCHPLLQTETTTLDQIVSKDVRTCRSWLDTRLESESIAVDIAEYFLEDCILEMMLELICYIE